MKKNKFRVWDKEGGKMLYPDGFFVMDLVEDGIVLMQYVGLKDKNGTSIYEGDVLGKNGHNYWVGYEPSSAQFWGRKRNKTGLPLPEIIAEEWDDGLNYEVIGNIWENPGLLEEKKWS